SGKTAVIAARVVYLALVAAGRLEADHDGAMPSRVLCLTFTNKAAEELTRRVRDATAPLRLPEGEEATVLTYHAFAARLRDYQGRKREIGAIDYGDQIRLAVDLAREHPEVAEEFRDRFRVVLLDEYQDTNIAQARLIEALCGPGYPITAVGDPDQNIYAWRGASLRNILKFATEFGLDGEDATQRPLYVNFRSGSRVLAV